MAEGKSSFVLYADYIKILNHLEDEEVGVVMRWVFEFVNDKSPEPLPRLLMAITEPIISQLKRDLDKWEITREGRSKAGKASAEARKKKKEQELTNPTSVEGVENNPTNPTVTVTVDDTVTVTVDESVTKIKNIVDRKQSFLLSMKEFESLYSKDMMNDFYLYWTEHGEKDKKMRFEKQKSFALNLRLIRWNNNNKKTTNERTKQNNQRGARSTQLGRQDYD